MDLQQVISIKLQCFSKVLLSWDVNGINNVEKLFSILWNAVKHPMYVFTLIFQMNQPFHDSLK